MKKKWVLKRKSGEYTAIGQRLGIHPVLARLLNNRGIETDEQIKAFLNNDIHSLQDAAKMKDMEKACGILARFLHEGKKIRIIGDYDVDGICASAILLKALRLAGADADAVIPHRIHDGYGVNPGMIEQAHEDNVDLILTCDNGIAAAAEVDLAHGYGIAFIITDHHEVPYEEADGERRYHIPAADAVVDPKQADCEYPFDGVCGAYIAYRLIEKLFALSPELAPEDAGGKLEEWMIQLATLATVCDVMELRDENRALVKTGLRLMRTAPGGGIRELLTATGLIGQEITAFHLGFVLGPCINATGRIDTPVRALELLTTEDAVEAMRIAGELKELNESRKTMTERACGKAEEQIASGTFGDDKVLVIYLPECHESIAGLVAGRVREKYSRPTLVITDAEEGAKGSARSIPAYHIYDALNEVADVFTRFGGHAQAAGFSLPKEKIDELRRRLNENCHLAEDELCDRLLIDMELPLAAVDAALLNAIAQMEPTGNGNGRAHFARAGLTLVSYQIVGKNGIVGRYQVRDAGRMYEFTLFRENEEFLQYLKEENTEEAMRALEEGRGEIPVLLAFHPQWNEYRGNRSLQLVIEDYQ